MPATTHLNERVRFLLATVEQPLWFALAGFTPWESEDCPPPLSPVQTSLPGLVGFAPVLLKTIVRRSELGQFDLPSGRYEVYTGEQTVDALVRAKALSVFYEGFIDTKRLGDHRRMRCIALCQLNVTLTSDFPLGGIIRYQPEHQMHIVWTGTHRPVFTKLERYYYFQILRHF